MKNNLIKIKNNQALTTSLKVAEKFEKEHKDVIKKINILIDTLTSAQNFANLKNTFYINKNVYKDNYDREQPLYEFNKDFFTLLVMGFTGEKALKFKIDYINAFNQMEQKLKSQQPILTFQQKTLNQLKDMLKDIGCLLSWDDLMIIQHKSTVNDVCQYLAANYFVNVGNINNCLRELENNLFIR